LLFNIRIVLNITKIWRLVYFITPQVVKILFIREEISNYEEVKKK